VGDAVHERIISGAAFEAQRVFVCILIGFAMTLFAWFGPWEWPAAPAFFVLEKFFDGVTPPVIVLLIIVNAGTWAALAWLALRFGPLSPPR
jgi:hypothetical protein